MNYGIGHGWEEETIEKKAEWFSQLPVKERIRIFNEVTELALTLNPSIADYKDAEQIKTGIQILERK